MVFNYIYTLQYRLLTAVQDNHKLLNGMHEGLLILNKDEDSPNVIFCNQPVKKIIETFLSSDGDLDVSDWTAKEIFEPVKIANKQKNSRLSKFESMLCATSNLNKRNLSLEQIIMVQENEPH